MWTFFIISLSTNHFFSGNMFFTRFVTLGIWKCKNVANFVFFYKSHFYFVNGVWCWHLDFETLDRSPGGSLGWNFKVIFFAFFPTFNLVTANEKYIHNHSPEYYYFFFSLGQPLGVFGLILSKNWNNHKTDFRSCDIEKGSSRPTSLSQGVAP